MKVLLAASALVICGALAPQAVSAAQLGPQSMVREADASLVQKTHWNYCRNWRHECAQRHGWRTRGFFRCLARHGC